MDFGGLLNSIGDKIKSLVGYVSPITSPIPGPTTSPMMYDSQTAISSGINRFGNYISGGKLAQNYPNAVGLSPPITPKVAPNYQSAPASSPYAQSVRPIQQVNQPNAMLTPTPATSPNYQRAIQEGFKNWGSPPAATLSGQMASYVDQYPIFKQYPFLLPAMTLTETGGGKNVKRQNNWTNWAVYQPDYNPKTPMEGIDKTATGIAKRSPYYEDFRKSGNLEDLAKVYAPEEDNPGTGGKHYVENLKKIMEVFNSKL